VRIIVYITAYSQVLPTTVWTQRSINAAKSDQFQRAVRLFYGEQDKSTVGFLSRDWIYFNLSVL